MTHNYAPVKWVIIGSDNDLPPVGCQAIIWTNAGLFSIDHSEQISVAFELKSNNFLSRKCDWKCRLQNGGHFISATTR